jgi:hypothetical protein
MRVSLNAAAVFVPMVAMALLMTLSPVRAAESLQTIVPADAAAAPQQDQATAAPEQQDSALNIIVIQSEDERFIPNPYKNPRPRLISDAWAQRT